MMSRNKMIVSGVATLVVVVIVLYLVSHYYAKEKFDKLFHISTEMFAIHDDTYPGPKNDEEELIKSIDGFVNRNPTWNLVNYPTKDAEEKFEFTANAGQIEVYGSSLVRDYMQSHQETDINKAEKAVYPKVIRKLCDLVYSAVKGKSGVWIPIPQGYIGENGFDGLIPAVDKFRCKRNKERIMLFNFVNKQLVSVNDAVYEEARSYIFLTK